MQDIDFEELDRAVNSVLGGAPVTRTASDDVQKNETVVEIPTTSVNTLPGVQTPAEPAVDSVAVSGSPAARRSSGRFMDFVHSSSDMRANTSTPTAAPVEQPVVQPVAPVISTEEEAEQVSIAEDTFSWPDPLDVPQSRDMQASQEEEVVPQEAPTPELPVEESKQEETDTPLETPFLTDTKIEKRPLGAFSAEPAAATPLAFPTDPIVEEAPITPPVTEPVAVETPVVEEAPVEPIEEPAPVAVVTSTPEAAPTGPISIAQQYQEQPNTTDQPSGAIYDTEAYHQPLAHPTKKSSGLWVILWILGLIVLGGGVGAAVYFFALA